ncbi:MAG TPA: sulfatase [Gemmatales bacterium]|nr:sulfatase [Gemmatales bacterium]
MKSHEVEVRHLCFSNCLYLICLLLLMLTGSVQAQQSPQPHFVFLVCEDIGPHLGCYGDAYAITPHLDAFARQGARFTRAFSHSPVCAPTRSGIITGRYPTSIGSHHMRSTLLQPPPLFTDHLKKAGYFIAWPGKTDFNFEVPMNAFDSTRDWTKEPVPRQPCFLYLNNTVTHESQIRASPEQRARNLARLRSDEIHDPQRAVVPPYFPDDPVVRHDIASYYDNITAMDKWVGDTLQWLSTHGFTRENTYIFFFGDHGWGMPRGKRWPYDSGTRVPLLVAGPGIEPGSLREDLVCFLDLAPTLISLAGQPVPPELDGVPILGSARKINQYVFSARDRMDETYDRIRSVRDSRYRYIRNFHPELPYAQKIAYMELMPTMQVWREHFAQGKLDRIQSQFFAARKPAEELYDLQQDPYEVDNLASALSHQSKLQELRQALEAWLVQTKDLGAYSEKQLVQRGLVKDRLKEFGQE